MNLFRLRILLYLLKVTVFHYFTLLSILIYFQSVCTSLCPCIFIYLLCTYFSYLSFFLRFCFILPQFPSPSMLYILYVKKQNVTANGQLGVDLLAPIVSWRCIHIAKTFVSYDTGRKCCFSVVSRYFSIRDSSSCSIFSIVARNFSSSICFHRNFF
jgi:hypothetical protein